MSIKNNISKIKNKLISTPAKLVAVSKTKPNADILEAYDGGQRIFGENYVQELCAKQIQLPTDIRWHFIGHLQGNKAKYIVPFVALIHGVDSPKLLQTIDKEAKKCDKIVHCLLQVHIAQEETKFGFDSRELQLFLQSQDYTSLKNIKVQGLMGMATNTDDMAQVEKEFSALKKLYDQLQTVHHFTELSMGMSADYELAAQHGATLVRVGSAVFGRR
jgi:pyridoxal phosphate enzyme (YggS family)